MLYGYTIITGKALLYPNDPYLHQAFTNTECHFNQSFTKRYAQCKPGEDTKNTLIWKMPSSKELPKSYHSRGTHKIIKTGNFFFLPSMGIGEGISYEYKNETFLLDNGYLISPQPIEHIPYKLYKKLLNTLPIQKFQQKETFWGHI